MKWFKHPTNFRRDPLVKVIKRKLGPKGLLAWIFLIETLAERWAYDRTDTQYGQEITDWLDDTHLHRNSKSIFTGLLDLAQSHQRISYSCDGDYIEIDMPELIDIMDETTRKLRKTSGIEDEQIREISDKKKQEENKSITYSPDAHPIARIWNEHCGTLPKIIKLNATRLRYARSLWAEEGNDAYWVKVIQRIAKSKFCCGQSSTAWRANFDFLLKPTTHIKVMEGRYDDCDVTGIDRSTYAQRRQSNNMALLEKVKRGEL